MSSANLASPLAQIAQKRGLTLEELMREAPPAEEPSRSPRIVEVPAGPELRRIVALPSREPPAGTPQAKELAEFLTDKLAKTANPWPGRLLPVQAAALAEVWRKKAGYLPIPVGGGKTLTGYLAASILGARKPLYMAPASLEKGVRRAFQEYTKHWHGIDPKDYKFLSYQTLGRAVRIGHPERLDVLRPDLIVFDEAHFLKNPRAAVTKKVRRYVEKNRDCMLVFMTGTGMRRSIADFSHLLQWALREGSPIPYVFGEKDAWCDHLDVKQAMGPRAQVGALVQLFNDEEKALLRGTTDEEEIRDISRAAVGRRIMSTPGVVCGCDGPLNIPLEITAQLPEREDPKIEEFFTQVRALWELPDGQPIVDGLELARHTTTMGLGYWLKWDPAPPEEWKTARKEWVSFARQVIQHNRRNIDSERAVVDHIKDGTINDHGLHAHWIEQRDKLRKETGHLFPPTVEVSFSSEAVDFAVQWAQENPAGIIWCKNTSFAKRVADAVGCAYYGEKGIDPKTKRFIEDHPHGTPMVAGLTSNGVGKNLQFGWSANLWLGCSPEEQALGRTHRLGQEAELVTNTLYWGAREHAVSFYNQVAGARAAQNTKKQPQRLCYARLRVPSVADVELKGGPRWTK